VNVVGVMAVEVLAVGATGKVTAVTAVELTEVPAAFTARILYWYVVPGRSPVTEEDRPATTRLLYPVTRVVKSSAVTSSR
jgi:hypothetical protein